MNGNKNLVIVNVAEPNELPIVPSENKVSLWILYPAKGHLMPCFPLMDLMKKQGYTVIVASLESNRNFILKNGFLFYQLDFLKETN